jgi:hypothetical protein
VRVSRDELNAHPAEGESGIKVARMLDDVALKSSNMAEITSSAAGPRHKESEPVPS